MEREVTVASKLLSEVRKNLIDVKDMCEGKVLANNVIKSLAQDIYGEVVPKNWLKYNCYAMNVSEWILDFKKRLEQFSKLI